MLQRNSVGRSLAVFAALATYSSTSLLGQVPEGWSPNAVVQASMDSLVVVAISSGDRQTIRDAVGTIINVGWVSSRRQGNPYPGALRRLRQVFEAVEDTEIRLLILGRVEQIGETSEQLTLLEIAARSYTPHDDVSEMWTPAQMAIDKLAGLGPRGHSVLARLRASGEVRSPVARARLEQLAGRGWRLTPP